MELDTSDIVVEYFDVERSGATLPQVGVRLTHRPTGVKAEARMDYIQARNEAHARTQLQARVEVYLSKSTPEARFHGMIKAHLSTRQQAIVMDAFRTIVTPGAVRNRRATDQ